MIKTRLIRDPGQKNVPLKARRDNGKRREKKDDPVVSAGRMWSPWRASAARFGDSGFVFGSNKLRTKLIHAGQSKFYGRLSCT